MKGGETTQARPGWSHGRSRSLAGRVRLNSHPAYDALS
jgi:hypothetical protein